MHFIETIDELLELKGNKIGFFGGLFNPPHFGHLDMIKKAIGVYKLNHIIILPQPNSNEPNLEDIKHRLRIMDLMFETKQNEEIYILSPAVFKGLENRLFFDDIFYLLKRQQKELYVLIGCKSVESCMHHFKSHSVTFIVGCMISRSKAEKTMKKYQLRCEFIDDYYPCNDGQIADNVIVRNKYLSKQMQDYINQNQLYWNKYQNSTPN